ncbi:MAG: sugar phosphate isomerase/epimerase [Desulfamplus sp.]|nr:sugar phosphate isomerase/epimerase [Desulfamplus sp.]
MGSKLNNNLSFKIGTTSFIYPDKIIPNVIKLGSFFDEIELLLFESKPFINKSDGKTIAALPTHNEIVELAELSKSLDITYNVHLPIDVSITDISKILRLKAIDTIKEVIELCAPLNPTTYTLHLLLDIKELNIGFNSEGQFNEAIKRWQDRALNSLEALVSYLLNPKIISVETLNYPFEYIEDIIKWCKVLICVDAGHLIKYRYNKIEEIFAKHRSDVPLIHLHGVDFSSVSSSAKDHTSLDKTPSQILEPTINVIKDFTGVVSLELFNYSNLARSLEVINSLFYTDLYLPME